MPEWRTDTEPVEHQLPAGGECQLPVGGVQCKPLSSRAWWEAYTPPQVSVFFNSKINVNAGVR